MRREDCKKDMTVLFGRENGEKSRGKVVKCNPKNAKVELLESRGSKSEAGRVWRVPYSMMEQVSVMDSDLQPEPIVYSPFQPMVDQNILAAILCCYSGLSPENLSCDGERPISQVQIIRLRLEKQLKHLIQAYGREVGEDDVYAWETARREYEMSRK